MYDSFNQPRPRLENQFDDDALLKSYLARVLPDDVRAAIRPALREMGDHAIALYELSLSDYKNEPTLVHFDPWGERVDRIELTEVWKQAKPLAATYGVVGAAYEDKYGRFDRVHQYAMAYLFAPSTDIYTCPLAMTDGAARTLLASGNEELIEKAVPRLTSREPEKMWTSGQWMTESTGGSDVGRSETVARQDDDGQWRLYGRKWFTSAATSNMAITLGRPEGNPPGGHGLALFFVETRDERGLLRSMKINRLKDKLGTKKVPTAELSLEGAPATLVTGETVNGVRNITPMLNITRTWNAVVAVSAMRRALCLANDYAKRRVAFGSPLHEKPLHVDTLAELWAEYTGAFHLAFEVVELIGRDEHDVLSEEDASLLRLLTPIVKLTTAKQGVRIASEVLEAFGGAGYVEDTGLPMLLRDAQVLPIWEGTTNVLSLDTLRALGRGADLSVLGRAIARWSETPDEELAEAAKVANQAFASAATWLAGAQGKQSELERSARRFALTLGRATELALSIRHAEWARGHGDLRPRATARRFAQSEINLMREDVLGKADDALVVFG